MMSLASEGARDPTSVHSHLRSGCSGTESEWDLVKVPQAEFALTVQSPKTVSSLGSTYTTYCIVFQTISPCFRLKKSRIRRRFTDFVWLRKELVKMDHSRHPPALAGKRFWNVFDPEFVQRRQEQLEKWLYTVLSEPMYLSCSALHLFLQTELTTQEIQNYLDGNIPEETIQQVWANHGQRYTYQAHNPLHNFVREQPMEIRFTEEDLRIPRDTDLPAIPAQERASFEDTLDSSASAQDPIVVHASKVNPASIPDPPIAEGFPELPQSGHPELNALAGETVPLPQSEEQEPGREPDVHGKPEDEQEIEPQYELSLKPECEQGLNPQHRQQERQDKQDWNRRSNTEPRTQSEQEPRSESKRESSLRSRDESDLHIKRNTDSAPEHDLTLQNEQKTTLQQAGFSESKETHSGTTECTERVNNAVSAFRTPERAGSTGRVGEKMVESPDLEMSPKSMTQTLSINGDWAVGRDHEDE